MEVNVIVALVTLAILGFVAFKVNRISRRIEKGNKVLEFYLNDGKTKDPDLPPINGGCPKPEDL